MTRPEVRLPPPPVDQQAGGMSAVEHPNLILLRQTYSFTPGVFEANITANFVCHTPGSSQVAGDFSGAEGMAEHQRQLGELSGGTLSLEHYHWYADDTWAYVFSRLRGTRGDVRIDMSVNGVWRFEAGQIAEHWELISDIAAWDRFWA